MDMARDVIILHSHLLGFPDFSNMSENRSNWLASVLILKMIMSVQSQRGHFVPEHLCLDILQWSQRLILACLRPRRRAKHELKEERLGIRLGIKNKKCFGIDHFVLLELNWK